MAAAVGVIPQGAAPAEPAKQEAKEEQSRVQPEHESQPEHEPEPQVQPQPRVESRGAVPGPAQKEAKELLKEKEREVFGIFVGDLEPWMDERYLFHTFANRVVDKSVKSSAASNSLDSTTAGEKGPDASQQAEATVDSVNEKKPTAPGKGPVKLEDLAVDHVRVIRERSPNFRHAYGFVFFRRADAAAAVLEAFAGHAMPGTATTFRLGWAAQSQGVATEGVTAGTCVAKPPDADTPPLSGNADALFVGDLASDVTDGLLLRTFQYYFPSVYAAHIVTDPVSMRSKGYGFVHIADSSERERALEEMHGFYLSTRPINVNVATRKADGSEGPVDAGQQATRPHQQQLHQQQQQQHNNATLFIGGIDDLSVTPPMLSDIFGVHGVVVSVKTLSGKGCAFVEYATRAEAESLIKLFESGATITNQPIWAAGGQPRIGWGRRSNVGGGRGGAGGNRRGGNRRGNPEKF